MRQHFPVICSELTSQMDNVVVLIGDIGHYSFREFQNKFPRNFYNLGIAEQALMGIASGLSSNGHIPIVHSIAPFVTERCYEQIKIDIGYQNLEVIIVSVGASYDYSHLGYTHHCPNDIAILKLIPNIDIYVPGSREEFSNILLETTGNGRPKYVKLHSRSHSFCYPHSQISLINLGEDNNVIIFLGPSLSLMSDKFKMSTIFYSNSVNSINNDSLQKFIEHASNKRIIVVEENNIIGGFGDSIHELTNFKVEKFGIENKVIDKYGSYNELSSYLGFTEEALLKYIYGNKL